MTSRLAPPVAALLTLAAGAPTQGFFAEQTATTLRFGTPVGSTVRDLTIDRSETVAVFASDRPGGPGGQDLWITRRATAGAPWSTPAPLPLNTPADEIDPALAPDGRELYFASDRAGGPGGLSIWVSKRIGPLQYGPPTLVGGINGRFDTSGPHVTSDNRRLLYSSKQSGGGDLYRVTRATPGSAWGKPSALDGVNDPGAEDFDPATSAAGAIVWFSSRRAGGLGGADLFVSWRDARTTAWSPALALSELNTAADDDGFVQAVSSGITYNNAFDLGDIVINCVCRDGPTGSGGSENGWMQGESTGSWPASTLLVEGVDWTMGSPVSTGFYNWKAPDTSYLMAISGGRLPAPAELPFLTLGAVEIDPVGWILLPPVASDPFGYARLQLLVPNRPALAGRHLWSQAFAILPGVGIEMTPPQRITLR